MSGTGADELGVDFGGQPAALGSNYWGGGLRLLVWLLLLLLMLMLCRLAGLVDCLVPSFWLWL